MATLLKESYFPNSSNFKLVLEYEKTMNPLENYHDVTFYLYFQSINGYSGSGSSSVGSINGVQVGTTTSLGVNTKLLLGTKNERYYHNADGTASIQYNADIKCPWSGIGTAEVGGTLDLPTIPREAKVTSSVDLTLTGVETEQQLTFQNDGNMYLKLEYIIDNTVMVTRNIGQVSSAKITFNKNNIEKLLKGNEYTLRINSYSDVNYSSLVGVNETVGTITKEGIMRTNTGILVPYVYRNDDWQMCTVFFNGKRGV